MCAGGPRTTPPSGFETAIRGLAGYTGLIFGILPILFFGLQLMFQYPMMKNHRVLARTADQAIFQGATFARTIDQAEDMAALVFSITVMGGLKESFRKISRSDFGAPVILAIINVAFLLLLILRFFVYVQCKCGLPARRRQRRTRNLVGIYADSSPLWQFVIWARLLLLVVVDTFLAGSSPLVQALCELVVMALSLVMHVRVVRTTAQQGKNGPFEHRYQNQLEGGKQTY